MNPINTVLEATSGVRRSRATGEGALTLADVPGESDLLDMGEVLILAHKKPLPVDLWINTM